MTNPNSSPSTTNHSLALVGQLFVSHLLVGGGVVLILRGLPAHNLTLGDMALVLFLAGVAGLLLTLNIQRSFRLATWALTRLLDNLPLPDLSPARHWPLHGLLAHINLLAGYDASTGQLRENLIQQVGEAAAQTERNRLARELHDSIKQQIFSLHVSAAAAEARWENEPEVAKELLGDMRQRAHEALVEMNVLLQQLAPAPLEKVGLGEALREQGEVLGYRTGAQVQVDIGQLPADERLPLGMQETLFRVAQETFSNIARHARASHVMVKLWQDEIEEAIVLEIEDDGQGFGSEQHNNGMGLNNMRQRMAALDGDLQIKSSPGQGTRLTATTPLLAPLFDQENLSTEFDQMLRQGLAVGISGGLALIAILAYPFYGLVPGLYIDNWGNDSIVLRLLCQVLAAIVVVSNGYLAARRAKVSSRLKAIGVAAGCGWLAGNILFLGLGGAVAGVVGLSPILVRGLLPALNEAEFLRLFAEGVINLTWWTYGMYWIILIQTTGLGALGGIFAPIVGATSEPKSQRPLLNQGTIWGMGFCLASSVVFILGVIISLPLQKNVLAVITKQNFIPQFWATGITHWPIVTTGLFYLASMGLLLVQLHAYRQADNVVTLRRLSSLFYTVALLSVVVAGCVYWQLWQNWHSVAATIALIGVGLGVSAVYSGRTASQQVLALGGPPPILTSLFRLSTPSEKLFVVGIFIWQLYLIWPLTTESYALTYFGGLLLTLVGLFIIGRRLRQREEWLLVNRALKVYNRPSRGFIAPSMMQRLLNIAGSTLAFAIPGLVGLGVYGVNLLRLITLFEVLGQYPNGLYPIDHQLSFTLAEFVQTTYTMQIQVGLTTLLLGLVIIGLSLLVELGSSLWQRSNRVGS